TRMRSITRPAAPAPPACVPSRRASLPLPPLMAPRFQGLSSHLGLNSSHLDPQGKPHQLFMDTNATLDRPRLAPRRLAWGLLAVLALAALLRVWNISGWSMWEDEEGSLRLAQQPFVGFQGYFPVFFLALNKLLTLCGLSIGAARAFPALMGLLSIALTY